MERPNEDEMDEGILSWREERPDLDIRVDNAIRNLHRNEDIEDFIDVMERTMTIGKVLKKVGKLSDYAYRQYNDLYMTVLVKYIESNGDLSQVPKNIEKTGKTYHIPIKDESEKDYRGETR